MPSAFVLFVMRELPPPVMSSRQESTTIAFISDRSVASHSQRWTTAASAKNQVQILPNTHTFTCLSFEFSEFQFLMNAGFKSKPHMKFQHEFVVLSK